MTCHTDTPWRVACADRLVGCDVQASCAPLGVLSVSHVCTETTDITEARGGSAAMAVRPHGDNKNR